MLINLLKILNNQEILKSNKIIKADRVFQSLLLTFSTTNAIVFKINKLVFLRVIFINQKFKRIPKNLKNFINKSLKKIQNHLYKIHFLMEDFQLVKLIQVIYYRKI